jgi:site-specific recombinase XerD
VLLTLGAQEVVVQQVLRHASLDTTVIYLHPGESLLRSAVSLFDQVANTTTSPSIEGDVVEIV